MKPITVLILLPPATAPPNTPVGWLEAAREAVAERTQALFERASPTATVRIVRDPVERPYGARLRELAAEVAAGAPFARGAGLVIVAGGSIPLAGVDDIGPLLRTATATSPLAVANSIYSADVIAVSDARLLLDVPDLPSDNALPRWLAERAGIPVASIRNRPRLALDIDSPIDALLLARDPGCPQPLLLIADGIAAANPRVMTALHRVAATLMDRRAEIVVAGRTSARTLQWLERNAACRVRALVEERGLKASSALALGDADWDDEPPDSSDEPADGAHAVREPSDIRLRAPRSVLGLVLEARGPAAIGVVLAELGDAAVIDTRVLLAHRLGPDESMWPPLVDRLASDLLRPDEIADPWLRALTAAAVTAPIPILLGGHTLVGPGLPLLQPRFPVAAT